MEIFLFYEMRKNGGNKNRVFSTRGRFLCSCVLLRFGNTLMLTSLSDPPSEEHTHTGTSPTTVLQFYVELYAVHDKIASFFKLLNSKPRYIPPVYNGG
jgi:hypothetical protein